MTATLNVTKVKSINVEAMIKSAITQLSSSDASIAEMRREYLPLKVTSVDDAEGLKVVSAARKEVKSLRCKVEKRGKELREDANKYSKAVIEEVKRVKDLIEPIETHLIEQEQFVEREKQRIADEKEAERQQKIQQRVDRLNAAKCRVELQLIPLMDDAEFEEYFAEQEADVLRVAKEQEAEQKRLDAERAELEAERERMRLEREEEQKKLDAERAEIAKQQEEERSRLQAEREKEDAERREAEAAERKEREAEQAELARLKQVEADRIAAEEADAKRVADEKAEEDRLQREAELKPIREQLHSFALHIHAQIAHIPDSLQCRQQEILAILSKAGDEIRELA